MADHLTRNRRVGCATRSGGGQSGASLLEVLVAVAILSGLGLTLMSGFFTTTLAAGSTDTRSDGQAALSSVIERMTVLPYQPCVSAADLEQAYRASPGAVIPSGFEIHVISVRYLGSSGLSYGAACGPDRGAELVRVSVTPTRQGPTVSDEVVLRDPSARAR